MDAGLVLQRTPSLSGQIVPCPKHARQREGKKKRGGGNSCKVQLHPFPVHWKLSTGFRYLRAQDMKCVQGKKKRRKKKKQGGRQNTADPLGCYLVKIGTGADGHPSSKHSCPLPPPLTEEEKGGEERKEGERLGGN